MAIRLSGKRIKAGSGHFGLEASLYKPTPRSRLPPGAFAFVVVLSHHRAYPEKRPRSAAADRAGVGRGWYPGAPKHPGKPVLPLT